MTEATGAGHELQQLADALLDAVEEGAGHRSDRLDAALVNFRRLVIDFVRRYNRLQIELEDTSFAEPVLFVANHGFGGIFDLNVLAVGAALEELRLDRPVTFLTHQLAWTLGVGRLIEHFGARPASYDSAHEAFAEKHHVVVFPGGDLDAFKSWSDRNQIVFGGRSGFARLAIEQKVPIIPIVTAGAGESLVVLADGERLARVLRLDKLLRLKALPITVSLPWGVNIGGVGLLPYLPLPTKLHTRVLGRIEPRPGEDAEAFAERVHVAMQDALTDMTVDRRPLLG